MQGDNVFILLLPLIVGILAIWGCYVLAERKGYSTGWAIAFGFVFGVIALIVYALMPYRNRPPTPRGLAPPAPPLPPRPDPPI